MSFGLSKIEGDKEKYPSNCVRESSAVFLKKSSEKSVRETNSSNFFFVEMSPVQSNLIRPTIHPW